MLLRANVAFIVAMVLHAADHVRQDRGVDALTAEVLWGGTALLVVAAATLWLVLRRHPLAPTIAAIVGFWTALAVTASHLAPHWSAFSDPYPDLSLDALSWVVMLAEIAAGIVLGLVALRELRRQAMVPAGV